MSHDTDPLEQTRKIFTIFQASEAEIRPHFFLTGPSGSGKTHTIEHLAEEFDLDMFEINAAQLTKEGTSGNSLSKALTPLINKGGRPVICLVDEFDKLFISGNSNDSLAHETTNGVQNEFLKVLESRTASVYGDYGKYLDVECKNVLFVFAGAFNNEEDIDLDRLRNFGIKTEFLGRVGLTYSLPRMTLEQMKTILKKSRLLHTYLALFSDVEQDQVTQDIMQAVEQHFEKNTIGVRVLNTLIHQYFIDGGLKEKETKKVTFQTTLSLH